MRRLLLLLLIGLPFGALGQPSPPDPYGYTFTSTDSLGGPSFSWTDIRPYGQRVPGLTDDNWVGPIEMGMDFPYYWYNRSRIWISDNGAIAFGALPTLADINPIGFPLLPQSDGQEDLIAPFMADLTFLGANNPAEVYTWLDTPNQRFYISYHRVPFFASGGLGYAGSNTFQVVLDARDSSIAFHYLQQQGSIDPVYANRQNPIVRGIEDVTGAFGLTVANDLPGDSSCLIFFPPPTPQSPARDLQASWLRHPGNQGFFVPFTPPPTGPQPEFPSVVQNIGNTSFQDSISVHFSLQTELGFSYQQTQTLMAPPAGGGTDSLDFRLPFSLPFPTAYTLGMKVAGVGDINPANDSLSVEMVVVDTFGGSSWLSYVTEPENPMRADGIEGRADSTNQSGLAVFYQPVFDPSVVDGVEFFFSPFPDSFASLQVGNAYRVEIYDVGNQAGRPGALLRRATVPATEVQFGRWNGIRLDPPVPVSQAGFYVAWVPLSDSLALLSESDSVASPISRRTFEVQQGEWKAHRSNDQKDFWIQVRVRKALAHSLAEMPPWPDFRLFPNPAVAWAQLELSWPQAETGSVILMDGAGKIVRRKHFFNQKDWTHRLNLIGLPAGRYWLSLQLGGRHQGRWLLRK
jgi:hypothetical protein